MSALERARSALDRAFDRAAGATPGERLLIAVASTTLALLIGVLIVAAAGYDPVLFLENLLYGAFGTGNRVASTLKPTTSFILAGVAVAVAFRAGIFNIGVQGQFVVGGFAAAVTIVTLAPALPGGAIGGAALIVLGILLAVIAGGLYGAFPGVLKAYAGANEVITTIMLNFIASGLVFWLLDAFFRPEGTFFVRTARFPNYVRFPSILFGEPSFSVVGLAIAVAAAVLIYVVMERTTFGFDMVTSGFQEAAATYSGVDAARTIVGTMTLSGMVAGLGGAVFVIMTLSYYSNPAGIPTFGFDAIAVSLLGANNPLAVLPAGLLFGGLESGGNFVGQSSNVPRQLIDGVVGLVVLFVAAPELFRLAGARLGLGGDKR
ncbi:MAG: ABC transporter permease [Haloarculaceae archaeon]